MISKSIEKVCAILTLPVKEEAKEGLEKHILLWYFWKK
jgi:hypothetical protein